jgi:hypothetical protein
MRDISFRCATAVASTTTGSSIALAAAPGTTRALTYSVKLLTGFCTTAAARLAADVVFASDASYPNL